MTAKGTRSTGSGQGSPAYNRAKANGQSPVRGERGFPPPAPKPRDPDPVSSAEWPSHPTLTERAMADAAGAPAFLLVESLSRNLGTDAEIDALKAERARLMQQCAAAGLDPTVHEAPRVIRALHPREVVLPTILTECGSCVESRRAVREAEAARGRTERKYQSLHQSHTQMSRTQDQLRSKIQTLELAVVHAHDRMTRAGVPILGPVHTSKRGPEDRT